MSYRLKRNASKKNFKRENTGWFFIAPALIIFIIVLGYPIIHAIRLSFYKVNLDFSQDFVGFANFIEAFNDKWFFNSIEKSFIYTFSSVLITQIMGLLIALALNNTNFRLKKLFHMVFLIPWTLSFVVTGTVWKWIMNGSFGVVNAILLQLNIISENITFFSDINRAMPSIIFVNVWRSIPFAMVMFYAGLQLVPQDQVEAAKVDGANQFQAFIHVTIPSLRGVILVTSSLLTIWTFRQFDLTQILTLGGGPNHRTELLSNLIYKTSFKFYEFGYGAAISVLMLLIITVMTVVYMRFLEKDY